MWLWLVWSSLAAAALLPLALSLYEDQVNSYDWHQSHVGRVSYVSVDQSARRNKGVVVASEDGVLAVLNSQDGSIRWRQIYEPSSSGYINAVLRNKFNSLVTLSRGGAVLRSWDIDSGVLKYEVTTPLLSTSYQMGGATSLTHHAASWRPGGMQASLAGRKEGLVVVASGSMVVGIVLRTGEEKWTHTLKEESTVCGVYGLKESVYVLSSMKMASLQVTQLNVSTGSVLTSHHLHTPWRATNTKCLLTGSYVVCILEDTMDLYHASLLETTPLFYTSSLPSLLPMATPTSLSLLPAAYPGDVWVKYNQSYALIQLQGGGASLGSKVDSGLPLVGFFGADDEVVDVRVEVSGDQVTVVYFRGGASREVCGEYSIHDNRGIPVEASVQIYTQTDQSVTCSVTIVMEDDSIITFGGDGVEWVKEEGLGDIAALVFLDLPADQSALIEDFLEKTRSEVNPVKLALQRWKLQIKLFKDVLGSVEGGDLGSLLGTQDSRDLVRDQFNTRKIITAVTRRGKVYGLDSADGGVVWQLFPHPLSPLDGSPSLHLLRSTGHPLHPPLAVLVGRSKPCPHTAVVSFNPLTGQQDSITCFPQIIQTFLIAREDRTHSKTLLLLTKDLEVMSFPSSPEVVSHLAQLDEQLFFFVAYEGEGHMDGYYIDKTPSPSSESTVYHVTHMWHVAFPDEAERIVGVVSKPHNEHVSSMGRSHVDKSIQYKYLNPNLMAVVTESADPNRPFISVYLVDVVTGGVVFHTSHKAAISPVHLIHSENWIVYQFFNVKQHRHDLVVVELFERASNVTYTVWSSLTPPPLPQVLSQAYAVGTSFATMATTQTRRGITTKSILVGLKSGHIAAFPKFYLDPRRSVQPTDEMKEAGLPPYQPELGFTPGHYINYNQTVGRLREIYSIPSGLESTSLILACGLDLYFTRVLPSKQFDLLAVDFDYTLVAGVLVAMVIGTLVLAKLSARKSLQLLWK